MPTKSKKKPQGDKTEPKKLSERIEAEIKRLSVELGCSESVLTDFARFVLEKEPARVKELTMAQLQTAVAAAFKCSDAKELKQNKAFKLATTGQDLNLRKKEGWLILYREWVGVPESERNETGPHCINGIDVLKNFRPWHVFSLDPKTATTEDINKAFRQLSKTHHPDHGGDREVFERLQKMRDSLLAFR